MYNILVIDDEQAVRTVVIQTLTHLGFSTSETGDGQAGIEMAQADPPDLILCDVRMPGLDGYQTLAAIRDLPVLASVPFIFLTAAMDKHDMRRGMVSGADDYLTKPFTAEELLEAVTTRLARQTELKCEFHRQAEKLRKNVDHLLAQEFSAPLKGITGMTADLIKNPEFLAPEKVCANARRINESVVQLDQLARRLG